MRALTGRIGRDWRDSTPWWPEQPRPRPDAPNVVLVVLDDVGFAQLGCFGSEIATPRIDALAAHGVRMANFHTTSLCSPTRASLLTGRNHHRVSMGRVADLAIGFPGYWGRPDRAHGYLSEVLRAYGYATLAVGKWHLTPDDETHMAAPRDTWPLGRGFDRWYGFHGGETHQFFPALYEDNHSIRPPRIAPYHLTRDLADHAIAFVHDVRAADPALPFFLYFATGACHAPHQPPEDAAHAYRGAFDDGWDALRERTIARQLETRILPPGTRLAPRPDWVPEFAQLPTDEQQLAARFMEQFASFLSDADAQVGRVLDAIDALGELDNTLVVVVSDNGASAEGGRDGTINDVRSLNLDPPTTEEMLARIDEIGGPLTHNNYPWGWTMAGNTPFRRWKREVHEGGVQDPCIVYWPNGGFDGGAIRHQYIHAIDIRPTILSLLELEEPATIAGLGQSPVDGVSFTHLLRPGGEALAEVRQTQYYEMFGSRALYHNGWKVVTYHPIAPLYDDTNPSDSFDQDVFELYAVVHDISETHDLASAHPELVEALVALWWEEAARNQVLPLDNRVLHAIVHPKPDPRPAIERARFFQGGAQVPERVAVDVRFRSHRIEVDLLLTGTGPAQGVLIAQGSALGGWSLHLVDGRLTYVHHLHGVRRDVLVAPDPLTEGRHQVRYEFTKDLSTDGGLGTLAIDGHEVCRGRIERFTPSAFNGLGVGITCGYEWGPAVGEGYEAPFVFTGTIERAEIVVLGPRVRDPLAELEAILAEQ